MDDVSHLQEWAAEHAVKSRRLLWAALDREKWYEDYEALAIYWQRLSRDGYLAARQLMGTDE